MADTDLKVIDVYGKEYYRIYDFGGREHKIEAPVTIFYREGGTTHRVLDDRGNIHIVPAPGVNGCLVVVKGEIVA